MVAVNVKEIPKDLSDFIIKIQCDVKSKNCIGQYSQSQAILHIVREYKKIIEKK